MYLGIVGVFCLINILFIVTMRSNVIFYIYEHMYNYLFGKCLKIKRFGGALKSIVLLFSEKYGLIWCFSNREEKANMCNFKEIYLG